MTSLSDNSVGSGFSGRGSLDHRVTGFGRVGPGHGSKVQTRGSTSKWQLMMAYRSALRTRQWK